jgi:hypothetical protein
MPSKTRNYELLLTQQSTKKFCDGTPVYNITVDGGRYARDQIWELTPGWPPPKTAPALSTRGYTDLQTKHRHALVVGITNPQPSGPCFEWQKVFVTSHIPGSSYDADIAEILDSLWTKLRIKVNGVKWNAAVDLAESRKTISMILSAAERGANAVRNLKKGRIDKVRKIFKLTKSKKDLGTSGTSGKDLANLWLEYKYGWSPLFKSVADAAEGLALQMYQKPVFRFVRVRTQQGAHRVEFNSDLCRQAVERVFGPDPGPAGKRRRKR